MFYETQNTPLRWAFCSLFKIRVRVIRNLILGKYRWFKNLFLVLFKSFDAYSPFDFLFFKKTIFQGLFRPQSSWYSRERSVGCRTKQVQGTYFENGCHDRKNSLFLPASTVGSFICHPGRTSSTPTPSPRHVNNILNVHFFVDSEP